MHLFRLRAQAVLSPPGCFFLRPLPRGVSPRAAAPARLLGEPDGNFTRAWLGRSPRGRAARGTSSEIAERRRTARTAAPGYLLAASCSGERPQKGYKGYTARNLFFARYTCPRAACSALLSQGYKGYKGYTAFSSLNEKNKNKKYFFRRADVARGDRAARWANRARTAAPGRAAARVASRRSPRFSREMQREPRNFCNLVPARGEPLPLGEPLPAAIASGEPSRLGAAPRVSSGNRCPLPAAQRLGALLAMQRLPSGAISAARRRTGEPLPPGRVSARWASRSGEPRALPRARRARRAAPLQLTRGTAAPGITATVLEAILSA